MLDTHPTDKSLSINGCDIKSWKVSASTTAKNCKNYIRSIVEDLGLEPNPDKPVIALSLGDPTVYGNLQPPQEVIEAVLETVKNGIGNGYGPCVGSEEARQAVADYLSFDGVQYQPKDVILCSGCSSSIDISITVLADASKNQNILMPRPGFSLYKTLAESLGVKVRTYNLIPEYDWQVDLRHLEAQIDENTAAIVINNPSNPCGSVFEETHLRDILEIASRRRVPVISDEIYERLVFPGRRFVSAASIDSDVPLLICGGLAKRFLVPGWRMGWIVVHDPVGAFDAEIRKGITSLSQRTIGSNGIVQGALPAILKTPQNYHDQVISILYENAKIAYEDLNTVKGLSAYMPDGTMYMMLKIHLEQFPDFKNNGLDFMKKLMEEQSVFCLPGECFELPGFMRIVITVPTDLLLESCVRIREFCSKYRKTA